jgi:hypothetical protein
VLQSTTSAFGVSCAVPRRLPGISIRAFPLRVPQGREQRIGTVSVGTFVCRKATPWQRLTVCLPHFAESAKDGAPPVG